MLSKTRHTNTTTALAKGNDVLTDTDTPDSAVRIGLTTLTTTARRFGVVTPELRASLAGPAHGGIASG